jgi:D-arginine dehydrogenase
MRRTAAVVKAPQGVDISAWPLVIAADESFYFKPDAGLLLVSPADETPTAPCDAWADDLDVAVGLDRLMTATTLQIDRVVRSWAGLRSFAPDRKPVVGPDPEAETFLWLAGQGGYGIQTSPALSRLIAGLALRGDWQGWDSSELSPMRLRAARNA